MNRRWITTERVVAVTASIFLSVAFVVSILLDGDANCIFPHSEIFIPSVHLVCVILAIICIFFPNFYLQFLIMQIESVLTILTDLPFLGIFLFYGSVFIFLCQPYTIKAIVKHLTVYLLFHIAAIFLSYTHGWPMTFVSLACSAFYASFFVWIYTILKTKFSCFTPSRVTHHSTISHKLPGSEIILSDFKLNERQKNFIIENLHNNLSYKEISDKYNVSISTVKKEFTYIFDVFGVSKQEELHLLLLQYQVKAE